MSKTLGYTVLALAVLGLAGAASAADPGKGNFLFEDFYSTPDNNITDNVDTLKADPDFPDNPDRGYWEQALERPDGGEDYWGCRGRGYIYPPQTGDYTFWIASDDDGELWLSTDEDPANISLIANVEGWTNYREFAGTTGGSNQQSQPVALTAGKRYYVEVLQSDGTGGGHVSVAWGGPGIGAGPVVVAGKYLAPVMRDPEPMFMARNPRPADGAIGVVAPLVEWDAGATAFWDEVYFGTDPNPPSVGRQIVQMKFYYHLVGLEPGVVYYWKVDAVEADGVTIYEGPVWSFVSQDVKAYYPRPADGATSVSPTVTLIWERGRDAVKHRLYLGDNADAVSQGAAETDMGEIVDETTYTPTDLEGATTYYWRVDVIEADGTVQTGDVWSFTTFVLVDDFERYVDDFEAGDAIWEVWIDGLTNLTGSVIGYFAPPFTEQTVVHGGDQSMPFDFNNIVAPYYSEGELPLDPTQDWTVEGVTDLSLWVRGYPAPVAVDVTETAGKMSLTGAGRDIWDNSDEFTYAYKTLNGNGSIVARVVSIGPGTNTWAKGGVMIRDSLDGGSTHAMMAMTANTDGTAGNGASFQWRPVADDASSTSDSVTVVAPPYWVKIERLGDGLAGYLSLNGQDWTLLGSTQFITMSAPVYIGLCVTSHEVGEDRTFEFDNIQTYGSVSGSWQGAVISAPRHNAAQSLYVVVEDSSGKSAMVTNPDLVNINDWTEWKIALSSLGDVNLARVGKLYIGVGDRDNPTPDGAGMIFVDDIRVTMPEPEPEPEE